jgi:hypothetical protein
MSKGDLVSFTDDNASHHIIARNASDFSYRISWSQDGVSWRKQGLDLSLNGIALNTHDINSNITNSYGLSWAGRTVILAETVSTATNNSLVALYFGGYSTVTLETAALRFQSARAEWNRAGYGYNFLGLDLYSNYSALTASGAGSHSLASGGVLLTAQKYYTATPTVSGLATADIIGLGILLHFRIEGITGGDTVANYRGVNVSIDDGTEDYEITIRISPSNILIRDENGSSTVTTISGLSLDKCEFLVMLSDDKVTLYYRVISAIDNKRTWVDAGTYSGLTDGGGSSAGHVVNFGNLSSTGTLETVWSHISIAQGFQYAYTMHNFTNPDDLMFRAYPPSGTYAWTTDNVLISTADGQTYEGDQYNITPDSAYSINNVFYASTPTSRIHWKSESVTSGDVPEQFIALKLDPDTAIHQDESLPNDIVGLHLSGHNFISAKIEYYSSSTWTVLSTFTTAIRSTGIAQGRTLRGHSTASNKPYFSYNELADCYIKIQTSEDGYEFRKIVSNSEGIFGETSTTTKQCVLLLDEEISYSGVTHGLVYIVPKSMTLLVNLDGLRFEALGLRITTQETYDNDIRIGLLHMGSVLIPGKQYQRGRTINITSGTETIETEGGVIYARNRKPSRRLYRIAWSEGIDISTLQGDNPDPDFWTASTDASREPIAIHNDVPDLLQGMLDYLEGEKTPIVYLPFIEQTNSRRELLRRSEQALCILVGDIQTENVLGDELQSEAGELMRVSTLTLQEVL